MAEARRKLRYDVVRLAEAAAARGWTNEFLAKVADVHPATVGRLLAGTTQRPSTVAAVARALGIDLATLVVSRPQNAGDRGGAVIRT